MCTIEIPTPTRTSYALTSHNSVRLLKAKYPLIHFDLVGSSVAADGWYYSAWRNSAQISESVEYCWHKTLTKIDCSWYYLAISTLSELSLVWGYLLPRPSLDKQYNICSNAWLSHASKGTGARVDVGNVPGFRRRDGSAMELLFGNDPRESWKHLLTHLSLAIFHIVHFKPHATW